jgi:hypothetical protein
MQHLVLTVTSTPYFLASRRGRRFLDRLQLTSPLVTVPWERAPASIMLGNAWALQSDGPAGRIAGDVLANTPERLL